MEAAHIQQVTEFTEKDLAMIISVVDVIKLTSETGKDQFIVKIKLSDGRILLQSRLNLSDLDKLPIQEA